MALPHKNATKGHIKTGCQRLINMRQQQGNYAAARHLARREYTLEQALDLLGLPRRFA